MSPKELLSRFENFDINVLRRERGVKLELINPPEEAFVDGRIIRALQANLFAVLRDILFVYGQNRQFAGLLLDQAFLAGLGNYLRVEILWQVGLTGNHKAKDLNAAQLDALAHALLEIPRFSYATRGQVDENIRVFVLFKYQHTGTIAQYETITLFIPRAARRLRVIIAGR